MVLPVLLIVFLAACARAPVVTATLAPTATYVNPTETATSVPSPTPSPTVSPTPGCNESVGKVIEDEYQGVNIQSKIPILVYLPPCYGTGDKTYPTLYLLHGKPGNETYWIPFGVVQAADTEIGRNGSAGFIMVMPDIPEPLFCSTDGGPSSYEAEFTEGLLPYIESNFHTIRSPEARAIAGISRGGVWALEIGLTRPDLFKSVIALSPALSVNYPRPEYDIFFLAGKAQDYQKFFLAAGDMDWALGETTRLADTFAKQGTNYEMEIVSGEHEAKTWTNVIPSMLQFVTKNW
jgi:enterochelin esterase-like enzyme